MSIQHWKDEILCLDNTKLLPRDQPLESLLFLCRHLAMYKDGNLDQTGMKGVWEVLETWITRLLEAKDAGCLALFKKFTPVLLPKLADELDLWIRMEIVSRQIGYPVYQLTLAEIFKMQFEEVDLQVGKSKA